MHDVVQQGAGGGGEEGVCMCACRGAHVIPVCRRARRHLQALAKAGSPSAQVPLKMWKPNMGMEMVMLSLGKGDGVCQINSNVCGGCLPTNIKSKTLMVDKTRGDFGVKSRK